MTLPDGEIITRRKSKTRMSVGAFTEYLDQIQAYAGDTLGVCFE